MIGIQSWLTTDTSFASKYDFQSTISFPKIPSPTKSPIHEYAAFSFNVNELPMFHFKIRSNSWWVGSQSRFLTGRVIYNGQDSHCTLHIVQL